MADSEAETRAVAAEKKAADAVAALALVNRKIAISAVTVT
jgi:hypothetical protein